MYAEVVIVRASAVYCHRGLLLTPGALEIANGRIVRLYRDTPHQVDLDLEGCAIFPGMINLHCHLEYEHFSGQVFKTQSFAKWLSSINELKLQSSKEDFTHSIISGCRRLVATGTTTVVNVCSHPEARPSEVLPLRIWWAIEGIDISRTFDFPPLYDYDGVSPHSPYLASAGLYRIAKRLSQEHQAIFTTHVNESDEEVEMFTQGTGPLYELVKRLGRDMSDCGQSDALGLLLDEHLLPSGALLTHVNFIEQSDLTRLKQANHTVVHCPSCHAFFQRKTFDYRRFTTAGVRVALGTDSAASGSDLDMREEMRKFLHSHSDVKQEEVFDMCSRNAAKALGLEGELGVLLPGYSADFFAIPYSQSKNPLEELLSSQQEVRLTVVAGKIVHTTY